MQILAISGSLRASSTNSMLLRAMAKFAPADVNFVFFEGLGDLPHFSPDLDGDNAPHAVQKLRDAMQAAAGVLICTPEYAYGLPGSLKNGLDWLVSSGEFYGKPTAVVSASPNAGGGEKAQASLLLTLSALSAQVVEGGTLTVPFVRTKLNSAGDITDPTTAQVLQKVVEALASSPSQPL